MRIIAGKFRSRPLRSLRGMDVRPTSDRLRETLFNVLSSGNPEALKGSIWIDLFAGTGAVGIEAISRGAEMVYFVESSTTAADVIQDNLRSLGAERSAQVIKNDVLRALRNLALRRVEPDIIFLDPPYQMKDAYKVVLNSIAGSPLAAAKTRVIAEHLRKFDPAERFANLRRYRTLVQGDAALSFYAIEESSGSDCATLAK